jgi:hypothetical protein
MTKIRYLGYVIMELLHNNEEGNKEMQQYKSGELTQHQYCK